MLLDKFITAAFSTAQMCATAAGVVFAILVFCLVLFLVLFLLGLLACAAFDRVTAWLAARWRRRKRWPAGRIAQIILSHSDGGAV